MRTKFTFLMITGLMAVLMACNKLNDVNPANLTGKWNLVSDSTYTGVGLSNRPVNYSGQPGDYFNFTANGFVYTKEGPVLDTLTYAIATGNRIVIQTFGINLNGVPDTSSATNLTAHTLTITAKTLITPGGLFGRKVILSR